MSSEGNGGSMSDAMTMVSVNRAVADLRRGSFVVIESRGELALTQAAETVTAESLERLGRSGQGQPRLALTANRARVLDFPASKTSVVLLPITDSVNADTVRCLVDPTWARNVHTPLLPQPVALQEADGDSCASAAIRLSKLAEMLPAAVTIPLASDWFEKLNGSAVNRDLPTVEADAIARYTSLSADTLRPVTEARMPIAATEDARIIGFRPADGGAEHFAIVIGAPKANQPALCRLHSECFTGDILGSMRCDCGPQLKRALELIGEAGHGVLLYLAHEGRGIGLMNKLRAYQLQDLGLDTVDANEHLGFEPDERSFQAAASMLKHLGIQNIRLMTNNPVKVEALSLEGVNVIERVRHAMPSNPHNQAYLETKALRSGHLLDH
ncbi:MAG: GTP cyclohydrolase II [Alphaproteobacteria bacterium]|nr:GTP cyclohydrolase II [Alphaproteobacteria bacterium]